MFSFFKKWDNAHRFPSFLRHFFQKRLSGPSKKTHSTHRPALWMIVLLVGLSQFSETVYSPNLPEIGAYLGTTPTRMEQTLSIYLLGLATGNLFWGILSDRIGRRPCILFGLIFYTLGSFLCGKSQSIDMLLASRFLQAFGGSAGSVIGQCICRDAFHGAERGAVYASISIVFYCGPALGPVLGGLISEHLGWMFAFFILSGVGGSVFFLTLRNLPETHHSRGVSTTSLMRLVKKMFTDPWVLSHGLLIGCLNGMMMSYHGEGSFFMIDVMHVRPSLYGASFILIACFGVLGATTSKRLVKRMTSPLIIIQKGTRICLSGAVFLAFCGITGMLDPARPMLAVSLILGSMSVIFFAQGMMIPQVLSIALEKYQYAVGRASSFFGFFYVMIISTVTYGMSLLHNDHIVTMPLYFLGLCGVIFITAQRLVRRQRA